MDARVHVAFLLFAQRLRFGLEAVKQLESRRALRLAQRHDVQVLGRSSRISNQTTLDLGQVVRGNGRQFAFAADRVVELGLDLEESLKVGLLQADVLDDAAQDVRTHVFYRVHVDDAKAVVGVTVDVNAVDWFVGCGHLLLLTASRGGLGRSFCLLFGCSRIALGRIGSVLFDIVENLFGAAL